MKIIFLLLFSISTSLLAGRSPAVDPVTGISIEEYNETTPTPGRGFDFSEQESAYEKVPTDTSLSTTSIVFLLFASALPFVVWFGVMRALPDGAPLTHTGETIRPSLSVVQNKTPEDDHKDDEHWPKAS